MDDTGQKAELQQPHLGLKLTMEMKNDHSQIEKHQVKPEIHVMERNVCSMDGILHDLQQDGHEM